MEGLTSDVSFGCEPLAGIRQPARPSPQSLPGLDASGHRGGRRGQLSDRIAVSGDGHGLAGRFDTPDELETTPLELGYGNALSELYVDISPDGPLSIPIGNLHVADSVADRERGRVLKSRTSCESLVGRVGSIMGPAPPRQIGRASCRERV